MLKIRNVGNIAFVVFAVKDVEYDDLSWFSLHLEIIALDESEELLDLVRFGLPVDFLKIDQFHDIGMDINVMTAVDTGKARPEDCCAGHGCGKVVRLV